MRQGTGAKVRGAKRPPTVVRLPDGVSHEFAAPIGTDGAHLLNAARANCALVAAEKGLILPGKWSAAFFTFRFHFQSHLFSFRLEPFR